jgi:hypothetical protein
MKEDKKVVVEETKKEEVEVQEKEQVQQPDPTLTKELEELRKFKQEVEAQRKAEKEKPDTVNVSGTFFSKKEEVSPELAKSNSEKF